MKTIELSLKDFRFKVTFIITAAITKKFELAMTSLSDLIAFSTEFIINEDTNFLDNELIDLYNKKKDLAVTPDEFEQQALTLIFQQYYNEKFENENFKKLIVSVRMKFSLRKRITVLFAENMKDVEGEQLEDINLISDMDYNSSIIFPLFLETNSIPPFRTHRAILALPEPVFIIPVTEEKYLKTTAYNVDSHTALFQKSWNNKARRAQVSLEVY